ncbi:lamin-2-like isoform X2 [Paramacrobiotus metropolitanus]|nr:lamin-2-like isoform X2 [Paramacrobiotus metropolitanus]
MSQMQTRKKEKGSSLPKNTPSSSSTRSETTTSQTVYERQELETRTRRSPVANASTPDLNNSSTSSGLAGSPLSRQQEKDEFKVLNNRLATYIDTIRQQDDEIVHLRKRVETINSSEAHEAKKLGDQYGKEINNLRHALDTVSRDLAEATTERDELRVQNNDYANRNSALENEKKALAKKLKEAEALLKDVRAQLSDLKERMKDHEEQINTAQGKIKDLQSQIDQLKKELADETVKRVDAQNRLLSAQEDLRFQKTLHEEQMSTLRSQRVVEVTEVETRLRDDYKSKVAEQLDVLREDMEMVAREAQDELERTYIQQLEDYRTMVDRNSADYRHLQEETRTIQSRLKEVQSKGDKQNQEYRNLISRLENDLRSKDVDIQRLQDLLADRQVELQRSHSDLSVLMEKYQEMYGDKIRLDAELAAYHAMLKAEEDRLKLTSPPFPSTPEGSARRGRKRATDQITRTHYRNEATATGDIHIVEIDADGQFVRLENKSGEDIVIGGWTLHMRSDNEADNETIYKIHGHTTLKGHSTMTIWSANTNVTHDPPSDVVMEGRWLVGQSTFVALANNNGEEVARREMVRASHETSVVDGSGVRKRARISTRAVEAGDADGAEKNCILM